MSLLNALDADLVEKSGSILGVRLNNRYAVFHKPHPRKEIYSTDLKRIRRFLREAGILENE
ncbi:MAG: type II toxin-antitoxin system HicA family toxin [Anaerolineales bacterium]|nr:type II toxin-antitoxin system HicA family toxin [Anaerolineales bacterium]